MIRKLETSLFSGCFSESVTGELLRHVFSFAETKAFRYLFVGLQPDASRKCCFVLSGASKVQVHVEGYSFSLVVKEEQVPDRLEQVQRQVGELSRSTKRVLARATTLREMICSVLQSQAELEERVKTANPAYLDQVRLGSNLRENIQKLSLAKELSEQYDEAARSVLREMAKLAGSVLEGAPETGAE